MTTPIALAALALLALLGAQPDPQPTKTHAPPTTPTTPTPAIATPVPNEVTVQLPSDLRFEHLTHDFGTILSTDRPRFVFSFLNAGKSPISIANVRASCGCTVPRLEDEKREYAPGERGTITVEYEPKGKRGKDENTITVTTSEEGRFPIDLRVVAHVEPTVIFEPASVRFDTVPRGTTPSVEVLVIGRTPDFRVNGASISPDSTSVTVRVGPTKEVEFEGRTMRGAVLTFTLKPDARLGHLALNCLVRTNDRREPLPTIRIAGEVIADIGCDPAAVNLGAVAPGASIEGEFTVFSRGRREFRIQRVEISTGDLADFETVVIPSGPPLPPGAEADEREPADLDHPVAHLVRFRARVPSDEGVVSGRFTIHTDRKDQPSIPLAFRVVMRKPAEPGH